jgi:hypothetical protein
MKLKVKHAALALVEVSAVLALAACGGGNGDATDTASQDPAEVTRDVTTEGVKTGVIGNTTLKVTATDGGTVTSAPTGINCTSAGGDCSQAFARKSSVTLTATPAAGYTFSGWSGMCTTTTANCTGTMAGGSMVASATFTKSAGGGGGTTTPVISYTDTVSAPTAGGENNNGGYLSIFGSNFGSASGMGTTTKVFIGNTEVANYRYLGASKVGAKLGLQQLTVQVGSLGGAAVGTALPIKVVVNGVASNLDQTFTPTSGHVLFVSLSGNDTTAVIGDITHPFRSLQNMNTMKGAYFSMGSGDQIVIRGGNWSDTNGVDTTWVKFGASQYARNGTAKAYIHFTAYPGPVNGNAIEDVHYSTPSGTSGGIQGPWSAIAGTSGEYVAVSNLRFDIQGGANRDAAPINFQYTAGPWRVVNNEIGPWIAGNSQILNAAGISGHGNGNVVMGNHIHDIQGLADLQNHGIYADTTAQNWNVGYNWIHDMTGGSLIQFNDNEGGAGTYQLPHGGIWPGFVGIQVHHNWLENSVKYGVNFSDQMSAKAGTYDGKIWNNVIIGTQLPPLRILSTQPTQTLWFAFNTMYNDMTTFSGTGNGYVRQEGWANMAGVQNVFFNNIMSFGPNTVAGTQWFANVGGTAANQNTYNFKRNLYFASGQSPAAPGTIGDTTAIVSNPLFVNPAQSNFETQTSSPARKATTQALPNGFAVPDDFTRLMKRVPGQATDIGSYVGQ